ncbi:MAG: hypothetical protein JXA51_02065 [Dehalococcoidales bacterium]|nr:hypothetical protein [Dehalococcoidales bacterium]
MTENKKKILEMLADKKISIDDAYRLLSVIDTEGGGQEGAPRVEPGTKTRPKYLRVSITPDPEKENTENVDRVNVRVPMSLIRAGIKLTALIPPEAMDKVNGALKEKGINFDVRSVKTEDIEELIEALGELEVDVISGKGEKVKVYVE